MNFLKFMLEIRPRIRSLAKIHDSENRKKSISDWLAGKNFECEGITPIKDRYLIFKNTILIVEFASYERRLFHTKKVTIDDSRDYKDAEFLYSLKFYKEISGEGILSIGAWRNFEPENEIFYEIINGSSQLIIIDSKFETWNEDYIIMLSLETECKLMDPNLDCLLDVFTMEKNNV